MSEIYHVPATVKTPEVKIDKEAGVMEMKGRSLPEDAIEFYTPAIAVMEEMAGMKDYVTLKFSLEYLNTSSSSVIRSIMELFADKKNRGEIDFKVEWYFEEDDLEMEEQGKHYEQTIPGLPIDFIEVDAL